MTRAVCAEVAVLEPPALLAVTTALSVEPTSAATTPYDEAVAFGMSTQPAPPASHRRHRYAKVIGGVPLHVPGLAVKVFPT